jgi:hypothetical protein
MTPDHPPSVTEASRADAALAVIFSNPCACPERHAGTADGTCGAQSGISVVGGGYRYTPMCLPCAACVNSQVPPGRASGSASRRLRTG